MLIYCTVADSPLGPLTLASDGDALLALLPPGHRGVPAMVAGAVSDDAPLRAVTNQLDSYFSGELVDFDITARPRGTPFQQEVWACLRTIPYGATTSYGEIAAAIGRPAAARAVGAANGANPISIVIPCHRVVGASGRLTGYAGGLSAKGWLLRHEQGRAGPARGT